MQIDPGVAEAREARNLLDNGVRMSACEDVDAIRIQRVVRDHQLAIDPFVPGAREDSRDETRRIADNRSHVGSVISGIRNFQ
jgi:hypothetical protein